MKKVIVNNSTDSLLVMESSEKQYEIAPNSKQSIEIENVNEFRVFKKTSPSSKFCIGQYFSKETFRNIWMFGPSIIINLDSNIEIHNTTKQINITEKKYHFFMFVIFGVLIFNNELADSNDYHKKADKNKLCIFALTCMFPLFIISLILLIGCVFGIVNDFSIESVFICLFCMIPISIFLRLLKSIYNLILIDNKLKNSSDNLKLIKIYSDCGWLIKFSEM